MARDRNPFYVEVAGIDSKYKISDEKEMAPLLYTSGLTFCVGIGFAVKKSNGTIVKIGMYHSNSDYNLFSKDIKEPAEYVKKVLEESPKEDLRDNRFLRAIDRVFENLVPEDEVRVMIHFSSCHEGEVSKDRDAALVAKAIRAVAMARYEKEKPKITIKYQEGDDFFAVTRDGLFFSGIEDPENMARVICNDLALYYQNHKPEGKMFEKVDKVIQAAFHKANVSWVDVCQKVNDIVKAHDPGEQSAFGKFFDRMDQVAYDRYESLLKALQKNMTIYAIDNKPEAKR